MNNRKFPPINPTDLGLLFLRLAFGSTMLLSHGWRKLLRFAELSEKFSDPLGIGSTASLTFTVGAEFGCALLVIVGLFTRYASAALVFTMMVAAFIVHGADPFARKELALLYAFAFATPLIAGSGAYSVDALLIRRKSE